MTSYTVWMPQPEIHTFQVQHIEMGLKVVGSGAKRFWELSSVYIFGKPQKLQCGRSLKTRRSALRGHIVGSENSPFHPEIIHPVPSTEWSSLRRNSCLLKLKGLWCCLLYVGVVAKGRLQHEPDHVLPT